MFAAEAMAEMLCDYGLTHLFYVPVLSPLLMKSLIGRGVVPVVTHGEKAAVYMADGYARVSGRPGVCASQAIGSTNIAAGLREPFLARSPVLALTGGPEAATRYKGLYQDVEDAPAFEPVTKYQAAVDKGDRAPDLLRQAYREMTTGVPRPAHLRLAGFFGIATFEEVSSPVAIEPWHRKVPGARLAADPTRVADAAERIAAAERPIMLIGGGIKRSRAEEAVLNLLATLSMPAVTTLNGMGAIGDDHPLYLGTAGDYGRDSANRALSEADLVLVVGSSLGSMSTKNWTLVGSGATVVQIDIDPGEIGRNYPGTVAAAGDADMVLRQLTARCTGSVPAKWQERVSELRAEWNAIVADVETSSAVPTRPERLLADLSSGLPADAILVGDTGHIGAWAARHLRPRSDVTFVRAAGSLGWGLPASLGAKCAAPQRPVVCFTGDGGLYYHLAELETACRYGLNIVVIVNNNVGMNQEMFLWDSDSVAQQKNWKFEDVDLVQVARGFGCHAQRVDDPDAIHRAVAEALDAGRPALIDVRTDPAVAAPSSWGPA
ncbi:thiamine pyrophosphate-binding protein [Mycobacterium sp. Marseille-P9652]|uniref:thiamine pyrophosphate-binding protein n=1 Tax=Mycobacterium sp. Marseille-P9652 TaxID=2654950 RepID=UPI0012E86226|nr:thiamine pyrophosphate-binding protein [Mycobacterium sp. Marseille-P9652]